MCRTVCLKIFITLNRLWKDQRGASAIEYAVIAALIAAALVGFLQPVQDALGEVFSTLESAITGGSD